jgi:hypothetical protein
MRDESDSLRNSVQPSNDSMSGSEHIAEVIADIDNGGYDVLLALNATRALTPLLTASPG